MTMNDLAREHTTQQRQHGDQRQESVVSRAVADLAEVDSPLAEVREQVTDHRLHDAHRQENVFSRAETQIDR